MMVARPGDPLSLAGATQAQLMGLRSLGIETNVDLARLNPYDSRFKAYGDDFVRWVNSARALVADSVVRRVNVGETIVVEAEKLYDRDLIVRSIGSRLGVFLQYVQEEVRAGDNSIEVTYMRRVDDPLSLGPWLEYKMNARFYAAYLRRSVRFKLKPVERAASFEDLLSWFMPGGARGEVGLAAELALITLLSDSLHLAISERGAVTSTLLQRAVERASTYIHFHCGSRMKAEELAEMFSSGGVVFAEGLDRCSGEEALVIGEAIRRQRVALAINGQNVDYELPVRVIAVVNVDPQTQGDGLSLGRLLFKFPVRATVGEPSGDDAYEMSKASRFWGDDERLMRYMMAARQISVKLIPPPTSLEDEVRRLFSQNGPTRLLGPYQGNFIVEAAKARCRARLSDTLAMSDYEYSMSLLRRAIATWEAGRVSKRFSRGRKKSATVLA